MFKIVTKHNLSVPQNQEGIRDKSRFISPVGNAKVVWPDLGISAAEAGEVLSSIAVMGDSDGSFLVDSDGLTFTLTH